MQTRGRQSSIENGQMGTRLPNLVTDESSEDGDAFQEPPELPEEGPAVEGGSFIRRPVTNDPNQTLIERVTVGVPGDGVERQVLPCVVASMETFNPPSAPPAW